MIIGIPRERKNGECRVGLTPDKTAQLAGRGHRIIIERGAGERSGFTDDEYRSACAVVAETLEHVWQECELLVKVKEPAPEELPFFRPGLAVFSFLHPAVAPAMVQAMIDNKVTGLDYDLVTVDGRFPILEQMSIIAGKLSVQCGAYALQSSSGGRGVLLGGAAGVKPARVLVIGAGAAGSSAAKTAIGIGADTVIMDVNPKRLEQFAEGPYRARTEHCTPAAVKREAGEADLVIGAVLVPGALAPKLLTREILRGMKKRAVIVDICIDQGGFAETSRSTTISQPIYIEEEIVHYCVPNMPALVPRTATEALTSVTQKWIELLAGQGLEETLRTSDAMRAALIAYQGALTNTVVGAALGIPASEPNIP